MPQETITLVNNLSDKFLTAQDDINNNFNELYAALPPSYTITDALKFLRVNAGATGLEWVTGGGGVTAFTGLTDTPSTYAGQGLKLVRVNATPNALEFVTANSSLVGLGNVANVDTTTTANITDSSGKRFVSDANINVRRLIRR